jgi:hypothetical protein
MCDLFRDLFRADCQDYRHPGWQTNAFRLGESMLVALSSDSSAFHSLPIEIERCLAKLLPAWRILPWLA